MEKSREKRRFAKVGCQSKRQSRRSVLCMVGCISVERGNNLRSTMFRPDANYDYLIIHPRQVSLRIHAGEIGR